MKRVAVVGAGGMGRFHIQTLREMDGVEVAAIADPFPHPELADLDVPVSTDPFAVAGEGFDGVIVASTDETHSELTLAALAAGSRVLCEKPLAHTLPAAMAVADAEVAIGERRVQVGFMRRYDQRHLDVVNQIDELGGVRFLRCTHRNTNADVRPARTVVNQSIIHDIHTLTWLLGPADSVSAAATSRPGGLENVHLTVQMKSGTLATIEFQDNTYAYEVEIEASGPNGMVRSESPYLSLTRRLSSEVVPDTDWFQWFTQAYVAQDLDWVQSLSRPQATGPSVWDGVESQLVSEAALESLDSDGVVTAIAATHIPDLYRLD